MRQETDWSALNSLARSLAEPGAGPGALVETQLRTAVEALDRLVAHQQWSEILRLRELFEFLVIGDTTGALPVVQRMSAEAISAAERLGRRKLLAQFLHDEGQNLHRQGFSDQAISAFERSCELYREEGDEFKALESYYMTSLCHRALGNRAMAQHVLERVLQEVPEDDPWRGNPLEVMAWLAQDDGRLDDAERLLREAMVLYERYQGHHSMLVAQTLADLGEVVGLQGRHEEAIALFGESLAIIGRFSGQFDRHEARTKLKLAQILADSGEHERALRLLDEADDKISGYGHYYDLLWRIELARAWIYSRQRHWMSAVIKLRMALRYRRRLGLSQLLLARQLMKRVLLRSGLPR